MNHDHMDHGGIDHGGMDHGGMGHGDMPMCSMNMLFTWNTENLCIVFSSWRVTSPLTLFLSLIAVMALTAGYEAVREASRQYEVRLQKRLAEMPKLNGELPVNGSAGGAVDERSSLLSGFTGSSAQAEEQRGKLVKAVLYGVQVFYSFFIMLLFMTYNGWIMLAVGFGATLGYLLFGHSSIDKVAACH